MAYGRMSAGSNSVTENCRTDLIVYLSCRTFGSMDERLIARGSPLQSASRDLTVGSPRATFVKTV